MYNVNKKTLLIEKKNRIQINSAPVLLCYFLKLNLSLDIVYIEIQLVFNFL